MPAPSDPAPQPPPPPPAPPHHRPSDARQLRGPSPAGEPAPPPTSQLAAAALAVSAVACCPAASVVGMGLAVAALLRIRRAGGRLGGRRLALAAMALASAGLIAQTVLLERFNAEYRRRLDRSMQERMALVMEALQRGDVQGVDASWQAGAAPTPDEIERVARAIDERYGRFVGMAIVARTPDGSFARPTMDVAAIFTFERRQLTGGATFALTPSMGRIFPETMLVELVIEDAEHGELSLGDGAR